ncbi:MAG: universal stress protein [Candidatus Nitrosopolaris sp.]
MTTENKAASNSKIQMRKILVPIDGSECSLNAAKYAVKVAKDENAKLFCIHVIASVPYGYAILRLQQTSTLKILNKKFNLGLTK